MLVTKESVELKGKPESKVVKPIITTLVIVAVTGVVFFLSFYFIFPSNSEEQQNGSEEINLILGEDFSRFGVADHIADKFGWEDSKKRQFLTAWRSMQWDAFYGHLGNVLEEEFSWDVSQRNVFFTHSEEIINSSKDILGNIFVADHYSFANPDTPPAFVAETLIERVVEEYQEDIEQFLRDRITFDQKEEAHLFVVGELELLPDLLPLPPKDVAIRNTGDRELLVFATTYYNAGDGNLELVADSQTAGIEGDVERMIFQRVYLSNGGFKDRPVGVFTWHEDHLHYHFEDFVDFTLESIDDEDDIPQLVKKSTFCIRDVSRINLEGRKVGTAEYRVCGKERQGVTVGWGDTYFHTYSGQNIDITDFPSGTYKLSFVVNPMGNLKEITRDNNRSGAIIEIDKISGTVEVISLEPESFPEFDYVHLNQETN